MIRYIAIPEEDILSDPEAAGGMLLRAVRRTSRLKFRTLVPLGDTLLAVFDVADRTIRPPEKFVFSMFRSRSADGAAAEITARADAGYDLAASFFIGETLWGLYEFSSGNETLV